LRFPKKLDYALTFIRSLLLNETHFTAVPSVTLITIVIPWDVGIGSAGSG
jgi:hypothetical protein